MIAPLPPQETKRLHTLHSYGLLDTPPEPVFDELAALTARTCGLPIALITLIDGNRQWFKAHAGLDLSEMPREVSFCAHSLSQPDELLIVPDATLDPRFADNPFVTGEPGIRFYAGAPLCSSEGHAIGTLCVMDRQPRSFGSDDQETLRILGRQVMSHLELRRSLNINSARLDNSQRIAGLGDWEYDFAYQRLVWSEEVYRILGLARKKHPSNSESFYRQVHPDDLAFVHREKEAAAKGTRRVAFEHRIVRPDGEVRHVHHITEMIFDEKGRPTRESGTLQDITERHAAEVAMLESEERYRMLLMLSPDAQYVHVDQHITLVNLAFCELIGAKTPEALLEKSVFEIVHPTYHAFVLQRLQNARPGQPIPPAEEKFVRLDGSVVDVEVGAVALDFRGRQEVHVVARDITSRKRAEEELREKTAFLEAQVDASLDAILVVDASGKKILQNQRLIELLKMPELLTEADDEKTFRFFAGLMRNGEEFVAKVRHLNAHPEETSRDVLELKDGTVLDRYSSPVHGKDGKTYGRIWTFRDITAEKTAEFALRQSEERFKFVARAISAVVWDWDLRADTLWWSDGFLTAFGFAVGEVEPSVEAWTARIHPDDRSRVVDSVHQAIDSGRDSWSAEYRFQRKDGGHAFVQDRGYILRDAAGLGIRMVCGMRDLSEQKKLEAQSLRAQRMESIGTLAGGIAHDLNNVLAPIMMAIELLKLESGDDPRRKRILDTIHVSSRRGADLVRQVLSFARGLDGQRVTIRLRHLINEVEGIINETFPRNIRISSLVPEDLWPITGDPSQLHQVLLNLTVNARDAMPHGGALSVSASNVTLDAQYAGTSPEAKAGTYVLLQVTDTGLGIPPAVRERIFEPFFTTKEMGKGTGLGLSTVHAVVKSHGGFMNVESEVGRGTTFNIHLPADPTHRTAVTVHPFKIELPRGRGELVLVIDDEYSIRDITQQTLEAFGYGVITASDGAEAIALYARQASQIAVVITDMMMPVMEGAATIQVLKRINPAVRIIATSGLEVTENVAKAARSGVHDFLAKPYTAETLLKRIREVLDRSTQVTA